MTPPPRQYHPNRSDQLAPRGRCRAILQDSYCTKLVRRCHKPVNRPLAIGRAALRAALSILERLVFDALGTRPLVGFAPRGGVASETFRGMGLGRRCGPFGEQTYLWPNTEEETCTKTTVLQFMNADFTRDSSFSGQPIRDRTTVVYSLSSVYD